ncbi:uncharacterized protein ISCGN_016027 [Ixodes scapularis]
MAAHAFACLRLLICLAVLLALRQRLPSPPTTHKRLVADPWTTASLSNVAACGEDSLWQAGVRPSYRRYPHGCPRRKPYLTLLLLIAGDAPSNPGPRPTCPRCSRSVFDNVAALQCDGCDSWFHRKCEGVSLPTHRRLSSSPSEWFCAVCQLPPLADDLFPQKQHGAPASPTTITSPPKQCSDSPPMSGGARRSPDSFTADGAPRASGEISVWFSNIRSLKNKLPDFKALTSSFPDTIFAVCETWLDASVFDGQLIDLAQFSLFRQDRPSTAGGVLLAVPKHLPSRRLDYLTQPGLEAIFVEVFCRRGKLLLACAYCPPSVREYSYALLHDSLQRIDPSRFSALFLFGDFNSHINWNGTTTFLDLALTNNPTLSHHCTVIPSLPGSDHRALLTNIHCTAPKQGHQARNFLQFAKTDFPHLNQLIHLAPSSIVFDHLSADDAYDLCLDMMSAIQRECVPVRVSRKRGNLPRMTKEIVTLVRRKNRLFSKARKTQNPTHLSQACQARKEVKRLIYVAHNTYLQQLAAKATRQPKLFWAYFHHQRRLSQAPVFTHDGIPYSKPEDILKLLSRHFSLAPTLVNPTAPDPQPAQPKIPPLQTKQGTTLSSIVILPSETYEALARVNPSQRPGPDGLHPALLKACAGRISPVLTRLFNDFLSRSSVPESWKVASVTPLHKWHGAPKSDICSYRPISTTSSVCRTMERVINKHLLTHLWLSNLLSPHQYGFRPGRSCESALATVTHTLSASLDGRIPCEIVQLDFKKAFDSIDHDLLLPKLQKMGISGPLYAWIKNFVTGRSQYVVHQNARSSTIPVCRGVPQGSVFGPTLFNIFIDDVTSSLLSTPLLYADDLTLINLAASPSDYSRLQADLDNIHAWSLTSKLPLNLSKCASMHITSSSQPPSQTALFLNGAEIPRATHIRLLGVTIDHYLDFRRHIQDVVSKARRLLAFVIRSSKGACPSVPRSLFTALVLPVLEYRSSVWDPSSAQLIASLDSVQRRAAYHIVRRQLGQSTPPYQELRTTALLRLVGWDQLQLRRQVATARLLTTLSLPNSMLPFASSLRRTRSDGLQPLLTRTLRHSHSFGPRAVRLWRSLPMSITNPAPNDQASIRTFTKNVASYLRNN